MRKSLWAFAVCVVFISASTVSAKTPDGQTPSRETVCDNETGAAYGLCVSYCEAKDCGDPNQHASDRGCEAVMRNFQRKTGRTLPCAMNCPCSDQLVLFAQIVAGTVGVQRCIADESMLMVITTQGDTAIIEDGATPSCNVNGEPPFVQLSPNEELVCRVRIREALEGIGVICRRPE
jgi:hypothetical protein